MSAVHSRWRVHIWTYRWFAESLTLYCEHCILCQLGWITITRKHNKCNVYLNSNQSSGTHSFNAWIKPLSWDAGVTTIKAISGPGAHSVFVLAMSTLSRWVQVSVITITLPIQPWSCSMWEQSGLERGPVIHLRRSNYSMWGSWHGKWTSALLVTVRNFLCDVISPDQQEHWLLQSVQMNISITTVCKQLSPTHVNDSFGIIISKQFMNQFIQRGCVYTVHAHAQVPMKVGQHYE